MKTKLYNRIALIFAALMMLAFSVTAQTTFTTNVSDPDDDCEEYILAPGGEGAGFMDMGSSDLELCTESDGEPHWVGLIFRNVTVPAGATISNAYVEFTVDEAETCVPNLTIYGAKIATMTAPFAGTAFEISSQPRTEANVAWAPGPYEIEGEKKQTPDLKALVQEIIGVNGWASGNNMMIVFTDPSETKCHQTFEAAEGAADHADPTLAALLSITYTTGTQVNEISGEVSSLIFPNPTDGRLLITNPSSGKFSYSIYNITGQLVTSRNNLNGSAIEVDLSNLSRGSYFVNVTTSERTDTQKLILK